MNGDEAVLHKPARRFRVVLSGLAGAALSLLFVFGISQAQVTPLGPGLLGTDVAKVGSTYEITGGTRPSGGTNLFHSFGQFSIPVGETALFMDPAPPPTTNIIGRVTDGIRSDIYGTINTATYYPGANLFLINPAGVVFGATASLNVGGSVNISTADYLRLSDPVGIFYANVASPSALTSAPVAAFGFLVANPATVEVQVGSALSVQPGQALSLVGGTVTVAGPPPPLMSTLSAPGGQINLVSVASPGEVQTANFQLPSSVSGGMVTLSGGAIVDVSGDGGGTVVIRGGQLMMDNALITANSTGAMPGAAPAVDINVQGDVTLSNTSRISAITSDGQSGDLLVAARNIDLRDGSTIRTESQGMGNAGNIVLTAAQAVSLSGTDLASNGSVIGSDASFGGFSGQITINASTLSLADTARVETRGLLFGPVLDVILNVDNVNVTGGSAIQSLGNDFVSSGNIRINGMGTISLSGEFDPSTPSRIASVNNGFGGGTGNISIATGTLLLTNGARINNDTFFGFDTPQTVKISVVANDSITVSGSGKIAVRSDLSDVGAIQLSAPAITVADQGVIQTTTVSDGNAGTVTLNAGTVTLAGGGQVTSTTEQSLGQGGTIVVNASNSASISGVGSGLFSNSLVFASGRGGDIQVQAGQVSLSNGGTITASSFGTGDAGNIAITAGQVNLFDSSITTQSALASGGNVTIMAGEMVRLNNSRIDTSVAGGPTTAGGDILIDPPFVVLQNNSHIFANAFAGLGGNITIVAGALFVDPTSSISASSQLGISGSINVQSPVFFMSGTLVPLPKTPVQAASLLQQRCAARMQGGQESNFVQRGRDGLPPEPGGWLASPMPAAGSPSTLLIGQDEQSPGQNVMLAQSDSEGSPMPAAISNAGPLTRLASANRAAACGL